MKREMDQMVGYHIGVVSHFIHNQYNKKLSELGLTISQSRVLYLLKQNGDLSQSELQKRLYIQASTMNGIIDSLLKKGLINKLDSSEDRRSKIIVLTSEGSHLEEQLMSKVGNTDEELLLGFPHEERLLLMAWLKRMRKNLTPFDECDEESIRGKKE